QLRQLALPESAPFLERRARADHDARLTTGDDLDLRVVDAAGVGQQDVRPERANLLEVLCWPPSVDRCTAGVMDCCSSSIDVGEVSCTRQELLRARVGGKRHGPRPHPVLETMVVPAD